MSKSGVLVNRISSVQKSSPFRDGVEAIFRRFRFLVVGCAAFTVLYVGYTLSKAQYFQSDVVFFVKNDRPPVEMSPFASDRSASTPSDESRVATEVQLLMSEGLHRQVIQETRGAASHGALSDAEMVPRLKEFDRNIRIVPIPKTSMIRVSYTGRSLDEAQSVLRDLSARYLSYHLKMHSSGGALAFFQQQADLFQGKLAAARENLAQYENQHKITVLSEQKDLSLRRLTDTQATLDATKTERQENEQQSLRLIRQLGQVAPRITTQKRTVPNQYSVDRMNTMLVELQNKRTELLTKFKPGDRLVQEVDRQIADTRQALAKAEKMSGTEESTDVNPLRQNLEATLSKVQVNASSLRARESGLRSQVQGYQQDLARLDQATAEHESLSREVKEAEDNYQLYQRKREEARIGGALDNEKISNVTIAEGPTRPSAANPRVTLATVCGLLLGNLGIAGLALFAGLRHSAVYTPWDLESSMDVPVLATVPLERNAPRRVLPERLELYLPELGDGTVTGLE